MQGHFTLGMLVLRYIQYILTIIILVSAILVAAVVTFKRIMKVRKGCKVLQILNTPLPSQNVS